MTDEPPNDAWRPILLIALLGLFVLVVQSIWPPYTGHRMLIVWSMLFLFVWARIAWYARESGCMIDEPTEARPAGNDPWRNLYLGGALGAWFWTVAAMLPPTQWAAGTFGVTCFAAIWLYLAFGYAQRGDSN